MQPPSRSVRRARSSFRKKKAPPHGRLKLDDASGRTFEAEVLGFDPTLRIGVARLEGPKLPPIRVATLPGLALERWVITLRHRKDGVPEPFAGVVTQSPKLQRQRPKTKRKQGSSLTVWSARVARVAAPGQPGSPVLSTQGELLGVVIDGGERRCSVLSVESMTPYLRSVVLGSGR